MQKIDFLRLPIAFARDQNKTLWADYDGKRLIVVRAGKGQRRFLGKVNGKKVTEGPNEKEVVYNLHQIFSAW